MVIKNKPDKETLYKLYVDDGLSAVEISEIYRYDPSTIYNWLKLYNIQPKTIINKLDKELLYKLYINDGLSSIDIAKIYSYDPTTICNWLRKYDIRLRNYSEASIKIYENPAAREKAKDAQDEYWKDPLVRDKQRERAIKQWEDPLQHERARERLIKQWCDPLGREKLIKKWKNPEDREKLINRMIDGWKNPQAHKNARDSANKRWDISLEHERHSASVQGQDYEAGEWTGFTDKSRPHLIPINQCLQLNPWFEGCVRHHIMSGVIIHIPEELHRKISHRMTNGDRKDKNMKEINKLAFEYLLGKI